MTVFQKCFSQKSQSNFIYPSQLINQMLFTNRCPSLWKSRFFTSLRTPTCLCLNPRVGLALAGVGPSVCPRGPGSPAASTPRRFVWQTRKVSTEAAMITTGLHTAISQNLLVAFNNHQTSALSCLQRGFSCFLSTFKLTSIMTFPNEILSLRRGRF